MLSCHEVTRLISESRERKLKLKEKLNLKVHTVMCKACKNFGVQSDVIGQAMKRFSRRSPPQDQDGLPDRNGDDK